MRTIVAGDLTSHRRRLRRTGDGRWSSAARGALCAVASQVCLAVVATLAQAQAAGGSPPPTAALGAAGEARLELALQPCTTASYDAGELFELARIELRGLGIDRVEASSAGSEPAGAANDAQRLLARVDVGCGAAADTLALELSDFVQGNRVARDVLVSDVPPAARGRALAIAIASLIESAWARPAMASALAPVATTERASAPQLPARVRSALINRLQLVEAPAPRVAEPPDRRPFTAALALRSFPSRSTALVGVDVGYTPCLARRFCLGIALEGLFGRQSVRDAMGPLADLDLLWLGAAVAAHYALDVEPELRIGPQLRAGYARVSASPLSEEYAGRDRERWFVVLGASAELRVGRGEDVQLLIGLDLGYVLGGTIFVADSARTAGMTDVTTALRLGIAF